MWVSPEVTVADARVLDGSASSDHHPLLINLELPGALARTADELGTVP